MEAPFLKERFDLESPKGAEELLSLVLGSAACPAYSMNIDQLQGYLRSIAAEPAANHPQDWIPLIFGGELPSRIDEFDAASITKALFCTYNSIRESVLKQECVLHFAPEYLEDRKLRVKCEQWARGYLQGYIHWQNIWDQYFDETQTSSKLAVILPGSINDDLDAILATVSAVADAEYALLTGVTRTELTHMFNCLPQKVIEYERIAHVIRTSS